jgi:copper chaperone CopZ
MYNMRGNSRSNFVVKTTIMTHTYTITGMHCKSCAAKIKSALLSMGDITEADVQLESPQARITMQKHVPIATLAAAISKTGNYHIAEADGGMEHQVSWLQTYKPVLLIFGYITGLTLLLQLGQKTFNGMVWMQQFMSGFFLVFSFFKFLDLKAFAESYAMYDILAKRWNAWGYLYPFAELGLGIAYLLVPQYISTNIFTLLIMSISLVGVLQSIVQKRKIACACLGAVFKLPMSTITLAEDGLMVGMSAVMLMILL